MSRDIYSALTCKESGTPDLQTNGGLLYYTYDGLGNVSLLTDRLGEPEARYRYDAFGGLLTSATAPYNLYGSFGKEFDPASGLVYFGARWYDASAGRFTTPDREVWATTWLASTEVSYTREVSRSPSEAVLQHVYRHSHQYQYINLRSERRVRPDGHEYWELVKDIEYTYWRTIEHSEEWETIDLIGPKRQDLVERAGAVPLIGWGATEIVRYLGEPPAPV